MSGLVNVGQTAAANTTGPQARPPVGRLGMKKGLKKPALNPRGARSSLLAMIGKPMEPAG